MEESPAIMDIAVVTPHGAPIHGARVRIIGACVDGVSRESASGIYEGVLPEPGEYVLIIECYNQPGGFDHRTLRAPLFYLHNGEQPGILPLRPPEGERSRVEEIRREGDRYQVRVTLDYLWFSGIGYPPTLGNQVEVCTDGELGWKAVAEAARGARRTLRLTTWYYDPRMMLERPEPLTNPEERSALTVQSQLETLADAGVLVQLLLWDAPFVSLPSALRGKARAVEDNFEVMQEKNPTRQPLFTEEKGHFYNELFGTFEIGSYHQKTVIIDGQIGFCGGMNLKQNDWDTRLHCLFDPRRCEFSRPAAHRESVKNRLLRADYPPRHDFMARVEGPAVAYLEENFRQRWNHLITRKAKFATAASPVEAPVPIAPDKGSSQVQVVRTMPEPFAERGILDAYLRAIGAARRLIYIEDQYFRSIHMSDAIADAVRAWPDLKLIVLAAEAQTNQPFMGSWSYECFARIAARLPDFELYTLRVGEEDAHGERSLLEVDNHAKLLLIDDTFLSVGSCNMNDRSFEYEGEISLAVVDPDMVRRFRLDLWREHLGGDVRVSGDIEADVAVWKEHAEKNRSFDLRRDGTPASHVFPFKPRLRKTPIIDHDVF